MRLAMRAGASDYLPEPLSEKDLLTAIERVANELSRQPVNRGMLLTVVNAKGGAGASFVASNVGCALAEGGSSGTLLADLDLQYGCQARYLDLDPERGVIEALEALGELDKVSGEAFVATHKSGLKLLAAPAERPLRQPPVTPDQVDAMLQVFLQHYPHVVADLPPRIDGISTSVFERSDRILLIVQQTVAHLNSAARMIHTLHEDIGIARDSIEVVVNRFVKSSIIEIADVRNTLHVERVHVIPNQYKVVSDSLDSGHPVVSGARSSAVAKALRELALSVAGLDRDGARGAGFLARALPNFLGAN
jgi:pilus assembly protein CpaE